MMRWMLLALIVTGVIAACGSNNDVVETPEPESAVTESSVDPTLAPPVDIDATVAAAIDATVEAIAEAVTATPEPTATSTIVPATATPRPTNTPRPEPTATPRSEFTIGPGGGPQYQDGLYVTIHSIEDPVISSNQFLQPDPGNRFLSLDTEICAGTDTASANPYNFEFQMPDNTRRDPGVGIREPSLNATQLEPNDCVRGWTTFQIPEGQIPAFIIYESSGYRPAKFIWPQ